MAAIRTPRAGRERQGARFCRRRGFGLLSSAAVRGQVSVLSHRLLVVCFRSLGNEPTRGVGKCCPWARARLTSLTVAGKARLYYHPSHRQVGNVWPLCDLWKKTEVEPLCS